MRGAVYCDPTIPASSSVEFVVYIYIFAAEYWLDLYFSSKMIGKIFLSGGFLWRFL